MHIDALNQKKWLFMRKTTFYEYCNFWRGYQWSYQVLYLTYLWLFFQCRVCVGTQLCTISIWSQVIHFSNMRKCMRIEAKYHHFHHPRFHEIHPGVLISTFFPDRIFCQLGRGPHQLQQCFELLSSYFLGKTMTGDWQFYPQNKISISNIDSPSSIEITSFWYICIMVSPKIQ